MHNLQQNFKGGINVMSKDNCTQFCIICGENFSDTVKPSKEHIIPEALGNEKLVTYCVCQKCNNDLGSNVDSYLTDYILVKMIRKDNLEKDKDLQIFDSALTDDKGDKYRITDQGPKIFPNVNVDKEKQSVHIEVASINEGKRIAKGILKNKFKKNDDEIEAILSDPSRFIKSETQYAKAGVFKQDANLNLARFKLAAIKIAYEYAVEKLGESYTTDDSATILRAYLKAGREGKKEFTENEYKIISERCHCVDSFTEITEKIAEKYSNYNNVCKIKDIVYISRDSGDNLICCIRILNTNFLTFTVFLSQNASNYLNKGTEYITLILDDNSLLEV